MTTFDWLTRIKSVYDDAVASIVTDISGVTDRTTLFQFIKDSTHYDVVKSLYDQRTKFDSTTKTNIETIYSDFITHLSSEYSLTLDQFLSYLPTLGGFQELLVMYKDVVF